jgi:hypothetical protein
VGLEVLVFMVIARLRPLAAPRKRLGAAGGVTGRFSCCVRPRAC